MEGSAVKSTEHDPVTGVIRATWESGLNSEVAYWRSWVETKGGRFPGDYASRTSTDTELQPHIARYLPDGRRTISILDVGSGPLTIVGRKAAGVALDITAVDALADEYNKILYEYGIDPIVRTQSCLTEQLSSKFESDKFDIAYARNTLDHSLDPLRAIVEMLSVVQKGGIVLTEHARNEGQTHKYAGLHQWNFDIQDGIFVLKGRNTHPINLVASLANKAGVVELTSAGHFVRLGLQKLIDGPVAINLGSSECLHGEM
jgi:SAM-dependent methyltransferase